MCHPMGRPPPRKKPPYRMDIDLLIAEVQKRRVLWDTTDEDRNRKNTAWIEVAEAVCSEDFKTKQEAEQKVFVQNVTAKWKSIRDSFIRNLKKQTMFTKSGAARKRVPHYIYEEQLRFLKKNREMRPTESTVDAIEDDNANDGSTDDQDHENIILNANENSQTAEETSSERTATWTFQNPSTINRKRKKTNIEEKLFQFIDTTLTKQKENDRKEPDDDGDFFKSLIPSVRLLTNDEKIQFRIEVLQLLQRFKNNTTANTNSYSTIQYRTPSTFQYGHASSYPNYPDNNLVPLGPSSSSAGSYLSQFSPEGDSAQY